MQSVARKRRTKIYPPATKGLFQDTLAQLVKRRRYLGLSQVDVNARIGTADGLVSKWECGLRIPTGYSIHLWASALGCRIDINVEEP